MSGEEECHLIGEEKKTVPEPEVLSHSEQPEIQINELTEEIANLNVNEEKKEDPQKNERLEEGENLIEEGKNDEEKSKEPERVEQGHIEPDHVEGKTEISGRAVDVEDLESHNIDPAHHLENPTDDRPEPALNLEELTETHIEPVHHHVDPIVHHSDLAHQELNLSEPHSTPVPHSDSHSTHILHSDHHSTPAFHSDTPSSVIPHTENSHSDPIHYSEPQQLSPKLAESPTKLLYSHLIDCTSSKSSEFLSPFLRKFKKDGKFHETLLLNYLSYGGDFLSEKVLEINGEIMNAEDFSWTSRSLQVNDGEIMFTGGTGSLTKVFILTIENKEIRELPHLNEGRDLHAMTWVDGKPAVIGGGDVSQDPLSSVEVFDKHWKSIHGLHHARYGHSATYHYGRTWVFAGANGKNSPVNYIEYYEKGHWRSLSLKYEFNRMGAGLIAAKNNIYILGGFTSIKKNTASVLVFNIEGETVSEGKDLYEPASFSQNLWRLNGKYIESLGFRGKKISYRPE